MCYPDQPWWCILIFNMELELKHAAASLCWSSSTDLFHLWARQALIPICSLSYLNFVASLQATYYSWHHPAQNLSCKGQCPASSVLSLWNHKTASLPLSASLGLSSCVKHSCWCFLSALSLLCPRSTNKNRIATITSLKVFILLGHTNSSWR